MRRAAALVIVLGLAADTRAETPRDEAPPRRDGYAAEILVADILSAGMLLGGVAIARSSADCDCEEMGSGYMMLLGGGGYLAGGPLLHHAHRRRGRTWQSAGLRLALPALGLLVARMIDPPDQHDRGELNETSGWMFAGGAALAMGIDWAISF